MVERWRRVVGIDGLDNYRVSDHGRVKNLKTGRVLEGSVEPKGYVQVRLRPKGSKTKTYRVHRLVCLAFHGVPPPQLVCNHRDGNKLNNVTRNLEWVTRAQNNAHAALMGRYKNRRGERNHRAKLKDADVLEMRRLSSEGVSYTELARKFGVAVVTAYQAVVGITWVHLPLSPAQSNVAATQ